MKNQNLVPLEIFCQYSEIELTLVRDLEEYGLIEIVNHEERPCIVEEKLPELEKMIRLHQELEINFAGIDTIFHLMKKMENMQERMRQLEARLRLYE
jgi:hypothetical protein